MFLMPLGMPWTLFIGPVGTFDPFGGVSPAVLVMLAPAINLAILFSICSTLRRRHSLSKREPGTTATGLSVLLRQRGAPGRRLTEKPRWGRRGQ